MCKVSVIVPLYNGEKTVGRCLDSLIGQELQEMEILVVDDGSTDGGAAVVRRYMERDPRIRLITQKNQGQGAARNAGLRQASGRYVGFVDCDDFVSPKMFSVMVSAIEKFGSQAAVCQEQNVYQDNGSFRPIGGTSFHVQRETEAPGSEVLGWLLDYRYLSLNSMCYKVAERKFFLDNGICFPEQRRYAEDLVVSARLLAAASRVVIVPESLYYYVHTEGSFTFQYSLKHAKDIYLDWQDVLACIRGSRIQTNAGAFRPDAGASHPDAGGSHLDAGASHPDAGGLLLNTDNFSLGMYFNSQKQIRWLPDKTARKKECQELLKQWEQARKEQKWKPRFAGTGMPLMHRIKVLAAWLHLSRPVLAGMRLLKGIPMFRYMT